MKVAAIVAEYNPFHNGHKFHIEETRKKTGGDCVIAVMSGNFVQRGEPALFNKWVRAEAAVRAGADLVLELPVVYSCGGAEVFAKGSVRILNRLGCVDWISFGAEESSVEVLKDIAGIFAFEDKQLSESIKEFMKKGKSYAAARSEAVSRIGKNDYSDIISKPNNILAVEYLKQLIKTNSDIKPVLVERKHAGYYEEKTEEKFAGAGRIRELLRDDCEFKDIAKFIPQECCNIFENEHMCFQKDIFDLVVYKLISEKPEKLSETDSVVEGIENRACKAARESADMESLINSIKSKRYSRTSIQRMLIRILLGIKSSDMKDFESCENSYARVLGFNDKGAKLIRNIKNRDEGNIRILTNINRERLEDEAMKKMLEFDILASDIYDLISCFRVGVNSDHRRKPFKL